MKSSIGEKTSCKDDQVGDNIRSTTRQVVPNPTFFSFHLSISPLFHGEGVSSATWALQAWEKIVGTYIDHQ